MKDVDLERQITKVWGTLRDSPADKAKLNALGKQLAMHVAAANPQALDPAGLDPATVKREKKNPNVRSCATA